MRLKLDENMPAALTESLGAMGHEVDTAVQEGLQGRSDSELWQATRQAARLLITQDLDFADIRQFRPGTHHGILLVRLPEPSRRRLISRARDIFMAEDIESWSGCFVTATDRKVRVRRPAAPDRRGGKS